MSNLSSHEKYDFKKTLEILKHKKGRSTELVSLYIPHDKQISDVVSDLRDEHGQVSNIKSKITKTNVQNAIESLMSRLRYLEKVPENGIVYFTGTIDIGANKTNLESYVVYPPEPIITYKYHCNSEFYLDPLLDMLKEKGTYGLLVLDRREATIGLLTGKKITSYRHLTSSVPGKQRKGGQSAQRFQSLRLIAIHDFYKRIGDASSEVFMGVDKENLKGILIGGPSPTKEEFYDGEFLHYELMKKIIGLFDVSYTDESGFLELINAATDKLSDLELINQKKIMKSFFSELVSDSGKATYGENYVRKNLEINAVDTLILSEDLKLERLISKCKNCNHLNTKTRVWSPNENTEIMSICEKCLSPLENIEVIDIIDDLSNIAEKSNTKIEFISNDFDEGGQLLTAFGGIAAILRYKTGI